MINEQQYTIYIKSLGYLSYKKTWFTRKILIKVSDTPVPLTQSEINIILNNIIITRVTSNNSDLEFEYIVKINALGYLYYSSYSKTHLMEHTIPKNTKDQLIGIKNSIIISKYYYDTTITMNNYIDEEQWYNW